ncbi:MAG: GNAT family N-acetyltransferase [Nesterenkonia sp.]
MLSDPHPSSVAVLSPSRTGLRAVDAETPKDYLAWLGPWHECSAGDVFSHPAYLTEHAGPQARPRAVIYSHVSGAQVLYAFLQRRITHDACGQPVHEEFYDLTTPLLYGGPLLSMAAGADASAVMTDFWTEFRSWARSENIISEFHRENPVTGGLPGYPGTRREQAPHIVKELAGKTEEELLLDASKDFRRKIRRTREAGMELLVDETAEHHDVFAELYYATMRRRDADARFFYGQHFFDMLQQTFEGQVSYLFALIDGRPVSAELALCCGETGYAFLGATAESGLRTGANSFLSHSAFLYAQSRGVKNYVLTGGVTNTEEDSLLRFKLSMAKAGRRSYFTAQQVIDQQRYSQLSGCHRNTAFFPSYRAPQASCTGRCSTQRKVHP